MPKLARLTKVNPREIWKHEAHHFTRWLAQEENIALLCEELGLNTFENITPEAAAGRYSVDIVADDVDTKRKVIIENQLEQTDHKHLGQLLTYASAYEASIIIWLVTDYTEEHRQAIDWFNRNIGENISFFLVQIAVYQIGASDPAPKFNVICEPNDWGKTFKRSNSGDAVSETKLLQLEFWEGLRNYAKDKPGLQLGQSGRASAWYDVTMGTTRYHLTLNFSPRDSVIRCGFYIRNDRELFNLLYSNQDAIEQAIGHPLEWMNDASSTATRIVLSQACDPWNRDTWDQLYKWSIDHLKLFKEVLREYL